MKLTQDQLNSFERDGYLVTDFSFDSSLLESIIQKLESCYDRNEYANRHPGTRVQDAWKTVDEVRQLARNDYVASALSQLYGRTPLPFQTLNFPFGTGQLPHSDTIHFNSIPAGYMAGVWVALEDIDEDNGPLIYYPGSHKLKVYSMQALGLKSSRENYPKYEKEIQKIIEKNELQPRLGTMKKGSALIWHANLLHGGAPMRDLSRTRHSQVTHFYFEDCKYYTPINSSFWRKRYRQPFWIPETSEFEVPPELGPSLSWYKRWRINLGLFRRKIGLG